MTDSSGLGSPIASTLDATPTDGRNRSVYGPDSNRASTRAVLAVSDALGVDPVELEPRLYDVIDPDALDALVAADDDGAVRVTFELAGVSVVVRGDGRVSARPPLGGDGRSPGVRDG